VCARLCEAGDNLGVKMKEEKEYVQSTMLSGNLNKDNNPFKDSRNRELTKGLFQEYAYLSNATPVYTLKEDDYTLNGVTYPSLKRLYLEEEDLSEYVFAKKYLNSYRQWKKLQNVTEIAPHIEEWREELEIKIRSKALKAMIDTALFEGSKGTAAAKYILDKGWAKSSAKKDSEQKDKVIEKSMPNLEVFLQRVK
jgi:hypothetical protein